MTGPRPVEEPGNQSFTTSIDKPLSGIPRREFLAQALRALSFSFEFSVLHVHQALWPLNLRVQSLENPPTNFLYDGSHTNQGLWVA